MKNILVAEMCTLFFAVALECWWYYFDILIRNETHTRRLKLLAFKYFAIQEQYFYFVLLHFNAVFTIGSFALVAVSTMIFSYIKHICGMFRIAR